MKYFISTLLFLGVLLSLSGCASTNAKNTEASPETDTNPTSVMDNNTIKELFLDAWTF